MSRTHPVLAVVSLATACTFPLPERECAIDDDCLHGGVPGFCLASPSSSAQWCAFPDSAFPDGPCASGLRWGILAGDELAETCVESLMDAGIADGGADACVPDPAEVCDGIDNDCDTEIDEGCPAAPALRKPFVGETTGSPWAPPPSPSSGMQPLRPEFRWTIVTNASTYQLQLDDSCETSAYLDCGFPTPEVDEILGVPSFQPGTNLPVSAAPPVGRRYFWRVRACNAVGCSNWSRVRYVDVGRQTTDYNGDGYADALIGAQTFNIGEPGMAYVFYGSDTGISSSTVAARLDNPVSEPNAFFGNAVAALGDVDGDGFADALVGAPLQDNGTVDEGIAFLYYGSAVGLSPLDSVTLENPAHQPTSQFGGLVAWIGDVNADGYADAAIGAPWFDGGAEDEGASFIYLGSATGLTTLPAVTLEHPSNQPYAGFAWVSGVSDVNGDGFSDFIVGARGHSDPEMFEGAAFVFQGSAAGVDSVAAQVLVNPANQADSNFGWPCAHLGDLNGDDYADVACAAPNFDGSVVDAGVIYLFEGSQTGLVEIPSQQLDYPETLANGRFGTRLSGARDIDGNGVPDLVVGAPNYNATQGRAWIYESTASGAFPALPTTTLPSPDTASFGTAVPSCGDLDGNGFSDVIVSAVARSNPEMFEGNVFVYWGDDGGIWMPAAIVDNPDDLIGGGFGSSVAGEN
jgi:hypothetical protein